MELPLSFFGVELEQNKPAVHTPPEGTLLHITMAALAKPSKETVSITCKCEEGPFVICHLGGSVNQAQIDLHFGFHQQIEFEVLGNAKVHLTGYYADMDMDDDEDFDGEGFDGEFGEEGDEFDEMTEEEALQRLSGLKDMDEDDEEEDDEGVKFEVLEEEEEEVKPKKQEKKQEKKENKQEKKQEKKQ
jgi:hypothetical protein